MIRRTLSYLRRNHLALVALVFAMAGTSYAASRLPRNSVGARQIKANAVTSRKIKNHTLGAKDFKRALLPKVTYWARISSSGANPTVLSSSTAGITAESSGGVGFVDVTFPTDVSNCAVLATIDSSKNDIIRKSATLSSEGTVGLRVATPAGVGDDSGFDIAVHC